MPLAFTDEQRHELKNLAAECDNPATRERLMAELLILRRLLALVRRFYRHQHATVQSLVNDIPRGPNPATWEQVAQGEREPLQLVP